MTWLLIGLTASLSLFSQAEEAPGDTLGWHVVQSGENLYDITALYLGEPELWRENWRLNPQIRDPHRLSIGQRIRVILDRKLPERTAKVTKVQRQVEHQIQPNPWEDTPPGLLLREKNGVRTFERSSAELAFDDDTRLQITERSIVFLQLIGQTLTGVNRESVEILRGQAEVMARMERVDDAEIEIIVGGARAQPKPDSTGYARTRTRVRDQGGAEVMVYSGVSSVESAGVTVSVPKGMGTVAAENAPPARPERLLPAPKLGDPARNRRLAYSNPRFSWEPVPNASAYTLEVCADPGCSLLTARYPGIAETRYAVEPLPQAQLFWRVTAMSQSGLDGFPSRTRPFVVESELPDLLPPSVVVALVGAGKSLAADRVALGEGGALRLDAFDDAAGVAKVEYRWGQGAWRQYRDQAIRPPEPQTTLAFRAVDQLGRASEVWTVTVVRDSDAPAPPTLQRQQ